LMSTAGNLAVPIPTAPGSAKENPLPMNWPMSKRAGQKRACRRGGRNHRGPRHENAIPPRDRLRMTCDGQNRPATPAGPVATPIFHLRRPADELRRALDDLRRPFFELRRPKARFLAFLPGWHGNGGLVCCRNSFVRRMDKTAIC
jgi:hypothetical protein